VDTSSLGTAAGSEIYFILTDGSGAGDANNTATLTNFVVNGGTVGAVDAVNSSGGVSGSMASTVALADSSFLNLFGQLFAAGSSLSFTLDLTSNVDAGVTPDQFSMVIVDPSGNPMPSADPLGFGSLLTINIDSANPSVLNYAPSLVTLGSGTVGPPPPPPVDTPEPSSLALLATALLSFVVFAMLKGNLTTRF
jgi:hypothetical protein